MNLLHASSCVSAVGGDRVGALQDHGAGAGGGRPAAPSAGVPAEGGRRVSVAAADRQPDLPGAGAGEKGRFPVSRRLGLL